MISRSSALTGKVGSAIAVVIIALTYLAIVSDLLRFVPSPEAAYPNVYAARTTYAPVAEVVILGIVYGLLATIGWMVAAQKRSFIPPLLCIGAEMIVVIITFVLVRDSGVRYALILVPLIVQTSTLPLRPRLIISGAIIVILIGLTLVFYSVNTLLRDFTARQLSLAVVAVFAWLLLSTERTRSEAQFLMLEMRKSNKRMRAYTNQVEGRTSELSALLTVSQTIVAALDRPRLLRKATAAFKTVVDYRHVSVYSVDGTGNLTTIPLDSWTRPEVVPQAQALALHAVVNRREAIILSEIRGDEATALRIDLLVGKRMPYVQSWLAVPLIARDRVIGVMAFEHDENSFYDAHMAELAWVFANQLASAMEHARLIETGRRAESAPET